MTCDLCGKDLIQADRRIAIVLAGRNKYAEDFITLADICVACFLTVGAGRVGGNGSPVTKP